MVEVVAVNGPLGVAHARYGAVQRITVPVNDEAKNGEPEPIYAVVGEQESGEYQHRSDESHEGEGIGSNPFGLPFGKPYKDLFFGCVQE